MGGGIGKESTGMGTREVAVHVLVSAVISVIRNSDPVDHVTFATLSSLEMRPYLDLAGLQEITLALVDRIIVAGPSPSKQQFVVGPSPNNYKTHW